MNKCYRRHNLTDPETESVFAEIIRVLLDNSYAEIRKVPLRKYLGSEHIHIYEKEYAGLDASRVFQISADPEPFVRQTLSSGTLKMLYGCFFLNQRIPEKKIRSIFEEDFVSRIISAGVAELDNDSIRFLYRFVPDGERVVISSAFDRSLPHFTYFSYDSFIFSKLISENYQKRDESISILDYCCGSGYVGLKIMKENDILTGVDINPSALGIAGLNAALQGKSTNAEFICNDTPPAGRKFDLIVCNPPYVFLPESESDHVDSYGGSQYGTSKTLEFVRELTRSLDDRGTCFVITRSPVVGGRDYLLDQMESSYSDLCGHYYDLCDASAAVEEWESDLGVEGYRHVFLSFQKNAGKNGWTLHQAREKERYKYAF